MRSKLVYLSLWAALAGCQSQNPYAAFGPATVPPPAGQSPLYYSAAPGAAVAPTASAARAPQRTSVSAEGAPSSSLVATPLPPDAADREPIRIVENSSPAVRTAAVPASPGGSPAPSPATRSSPAAPRGNALPGGSGAIQRTRGYASPAVAAPSAGARIDRHVAPAGYGAPASPFVEPRADAGQWRAR